MDKNKKRCKLSYFKKLLMLRELQQQGTLENFPPPECQRAFLNALSVKEFSKVYRNLNRFEAAAFEILLTDKNKKKFDVHIQQGCSLSSFNDAIAAKGSDEQILAMLSVSLGYIPHSSLLIEQSEKFFLPVLRKRKSLPHYVLDNIIERKREDLLIAYFEEAQPTSFDRSLSYKLMESSLDKAKEAYITTCQHLSESAAVYAFRKGDAKLCKEVLSKKLMECNQELEALFNLNNPEFLLLAVDKLNKETEAKTANRAHGEEKDDAEPYCFPEPYETLLMESGCFEAIRAYLSGRILGYNAEIALVKSRNGVLIRLYLESNDLEDGLINAAAEIIFSGQDKDLKSFYLEKYGLPYTLEAKLISDGDCNALCSYISSHQLCSINAARLMESGLTEAARLYCEKHGLKKLAATVLMKRGDAEVRHFYVDRLLAEGEHLTDDAEFHFLENGCKEQVFRYITVNSRKLKAQSVTALLNRGDLELIEAYAELFEIPTEALILFAKLGSKRALETYIASYALADEAEEALVERGDCELLIRYFEQNELYSKAECKLMQSDFARTGAAVRFYLDKYDLFEDAEVELVKRGDRAMLDVYIAKHPLGPDAENLIVSVF